jgi:hypothetical protein
MRRGNLAAVRVLAILSLLLGACAAGPAPGSVRGESLSPATAATNVTSRPLPRAAFGDGTNLVPDDVAPGTYRTVAYTEECYWVRLSGFEGGLEDWVSSGIGPGYHVVTIGPTDDGFDSHECGAWTADLGPVTRTTQEFGEGTYIVGTDLEPGTWTAESGDNCYWARLSGFGGTEAEIIQQGLAAEGVRPTVTITDTDSGFSSNGCGTWLRAAP